MRFTSPATRSTLKAALVAGRRRGGGEGGDLLRVFLRARFLIMITLLSLLHGPVALADMAVDSCCGIPRQP